MDKKTIIILFSVTGVLILVAFYFIWKKSKPQQVVITNTEQNPTDIQTTFSNLLDEITALGQTIKNSQNLQTN